MEHVLCVVETCLVVKQTKTHNHKLHALLYKCCGNLIKCTIKIWHFAILEFLQRFSWGPQHKTCSDALMVNDGCDRLLLSMRDGPAVMWEQH